MCWPSRGPCRAGARVKPTSHNIYRRRSGLFYSKVSRKYTVLGSKKIIAELSSALSSPHATPLPQTKSYDSLCCAVSLPFR